MNTTLRNSICLLLLAVFAGISIAAPPVQYWSDPAGACEHDRALKRNLRNLERDGFTLQSSDEQPIYYFVAPTGDHVWGHVTCTFTRRQGEMSLITDYVVLTVEVSYYDGLGYLASKVTSEEFTVN